MTTGLGPHKASEPGFIVAWHSKRQFLAGKFLNEEMTFGEAQDRARKLSEENRELTFWAEHAPQKLERH